MSRPQFISTRNTVLAILAAFTGIGILLTFYRYLATVSNGQDANIVPLAVDEMTYAYTTLTAIPIATWAAHHVPFSRRTWRAAIAVALAGAISYTVIHTTLMLGTRSILYPTLGLGAYDYSVTVFRYLTEGPNDLITFAFITGLVYGWRAMQSVREADLTAAELQVQLVQSHLENLRLQLNPHFLFNTLNAISSVMYDDPANADKMLTKLSDFLRVVLASDGVHQVAIGDEVDLERKYVDIMTARLERRFELDVRVADDARDAAVPFMILQPLLENSIKHGTPPEPGGLAIAISVMRDAATTVISVADDGLGYAPHDGVTVSGRGLGLVRSRLNLLYGANASLTITASPSGGTEAIMQLPFMLANQS